LGVVRKSKKVRRYSASPDFFVKIHNIGYMHIISVKIVFDFLQECSDYHQLSFFNCAKQVAIIILSYSSAIFFFDSFSKKVLVITDVISAS